MPSIRFPRCRVSIRFWNDLQPEIISLLREFSTSAWCRSVLRPRFLTGEVKRAKKYPEDDFRRIDPRYHTVSHVVTETDSRVRRVCYARCNDC